MASAFRNKNITQSQQVWLMRSKFPQLVALVVRNKRVVWTGPWSVNPLGQVYQLQIVYVQFRRPKVSILSPKLALANGESRLPHTYDGQSDICCHLPLEWRPHMYIADTIMPWISQWLYFYEIWSLTGKWLGKGVHPDGSLHEE